MININDTHRVTYRNAFIRGWSYALPNKPIHFYDSEGNDLGTELSTNSEGYISVSGSQPVNGYFVQEQAIIEVSLNNRASWPVQWVTGDVQGNPNDGKLLNEDGNAVWSANSPSDYTLNYDDLRNKPSVKLWKESEQVETVDSLKSIYNVEVSPSTTILRFTPDDEVFDLNFCRIQLELKRVGQQVIVINNSNRPIVLVRGINTQTVPIRDIDTHPNCVAVLMPVGVNSTTIVSKYSMGGAYDYVDIGDTALSNYPVIQNHPLIVNNTPVLFDFKAGLYQILCQFNMTCTASPGTIHIQATVTHYKGNDSTTPTTHTFDVKQRLYTTGGDLDAIIPIVFRNDQYIPGGTSQLSFNITDNQQLILTKTLTTTTLITPIQGLTDPSA